MERFRDLVEGLIKGTHIHQVLMHARTAKGDPVCFKAPAPVEQMAAWDRACDELLAVDPNLLKTGGQKTDALISQLNAVPAALPDTLPVTAVTQWLQTRAPQADPVGIRALANLYQLTIMQDRDADAMQNLLGLYAALGLAVCLDDIGLTFRNPDYDAMARDLAAATCGTPAPTDYDTNEFGWRLALDKVRFWGEKFSGRITADTYAEELLGSTVRTLIPGIRAFPLKRLTVLGHSFSMGLHWSSHGTLAQITERIFARENPAVRFSYVQEGGLKAERARDVFLDKALATEPELVLLVFNVLDEKDLQAFREIVSALRGQGARVAMFDQLFLEGQVYRRDPAPMLAAAGEEGAEVIMVGERLEAHPERDTFLSLDGIHMGPSYHKLMAQWLLEYLIEK